jgi:dipeptidyl aminopeptidase/acylaminoacyl peptidase
MMRAMAVKVDFGGDGAHNRGIGPLSVSDIVCWDVPSAGTEERPVTVLDVCFSGAVVVVSSGVQAPQLGFRRRTEGSFGLKHMSKLAHLAEQLESVGYPIKTHDLTLHPSTNLDSMDSSLPAREYVVHDGLVVRARLQATLVIPKIAVPDKRRVPLIVIGHGGPHASCVNAYSHAVAALPFSC